MDKGPEEKGGPASRTPDPLLRAPSYLAVELVKLTRRISVELFPEERMRLTHAAALACLSDQGPLCQREVSESLRLDPGDVVGIIDNLEELGYVVRGRDKRDRRRYAVEITPAGREVLQGRRDQVLRLNKELFTALTPAEIDQLRALLLRVLAHHDPWFADE